MTDIAGNLSEYESRFPAQRNGLEIFDGQWSSRLPGYGLGEVPLFEDERVVWWEAMCGGWFGKRVLDLGPLEGGTSYMIAQRGAAHVLGIEANKRAFLRCLVAKEALNSRANFVLGDFCRYLEANPPRYDAIICSGVLYHMEQPVGFLERAAACTDNLCIWTHYYDESRIAENEAIRDRFGPKQTQEHLQIQTDYWEHAYADSHEDGTFSGGPQRKSRWLGRTAILEILGDALRFKVTIMREEPYHPSGPVMILHAGRCPMPDLHPRQHAAAG